MPTIKLYASLRKLTGTKELSMTGTTVGEVLRGVVEKHPAINDVIFEGEQLRPHIVVTVNGHNIELNAPVTEQDVIAIFPPMGGG